MEGFWGMLKRERYYGKRFTSEANLVKMIEDYIVYYNTRRLQRKLRLSIKVYFHHRRVCICEAFPLEGEGGFSGAGCTSQQKVDTRIKKWTRLLNSNVYLSV